MIYKVLTEPRTEIEAAINKAAAEGYRVVSFAVDARPMLNVSEKGPTVTVIMERGVIHAPDYRAAAEERASK